MADKKCLAMLKEGTVAWNRFRKNELKNASGTSRRINLLIRGLPMDGSLAVRPPKPRSFIAFVITYIKSAIRSAFLLASSRIKCDIPMPPKCFAPASPFPL